MVSERVVDDVFKNIAAKHAYVYGVLAMLY